MKKLVSILALVCISIYMSAQITVGLNTLPEVGDVLQYESFTAYEGVGKWDSIAQDFQYWEFYDIVFDGETEESYLNADMGMVKDSFPDADMLVDFLGNEGYAIRNSTSISIIGFSGQEFAGLPVPLTLALEQPFVIRRAPIAYGDLYNTQTSFSARFPLSDFPELDTLIQENNPLGEGVDIDSFGITWDLNRTEEAVGWGSMFPSDFDIEILQVLQRDQIQTTIEAYIISVIGGSWLDVSAFLPEEFSSQLDLDLLTYKYLGENNKESLVEFTVDANDPMAIPSGRALSGLITTSTEDITFGNQLSLYPNPTSDILYIKAEEAIIQLHIYDVNGQLISSKKENSEFVSWNLDGFTSGHYYITVQTEKGIHSQRFALTK